jgi:hypothetical protein
MDRSEVEVRTEERKGSLNDEVQIQNCYLHCLRRRIMFQALVGTTGALLVVKVAISARCSGLFSLAQYHTGDYSADTNYVI